MAFATATSGLGERIKAKQSQQKVTNKIKVGGLTVSSARRMQNLASVVM
jgi:hypothetical protein